MEAGGFFEEFVETTLVNPYSNLVASLSEPYQILLNIFMYTILIAIYSIFVFEFYRFLARKNLIQLNLSQYNRSKHSFFNKFLEAVFFLVEYVIILPILVFFWFAILALLLMLLSKEQPVSQILLISAAIVGAIRVTSYFKEDLSKDLAKMFPFTVLVIFLLSPNILKFLPVIEKLTQIPYFLNHILIYLIFIIVFEILIRFIYTFIFLFKNPQEQKEQEIEEKVEEEE